jgi:hypothetical protein
VLSACAATALQLASPASAWSSVKNFFTYILPAKLPMPAKKIAKVRELVRADPGLLRKRSTGNLTLAMDGWTPLHAVAAKGNAQVRRAHGGGPSEGPGRASRGDGREGESRGG